MFVDNLRIEPDSMVLIVECLSGNWVSMLNQPNPEPYLENSLCNIRKYFKQKKSDVCKFLHRGST